MSFREKSAWIMMAIMIVTGGWYLLIARALPAEAPAAAHIGAIIPYVLAVIALSIVGQVALAIFSPRDAARSADERERIIIDKAGHWSGIVLSAAIVVALGRSLFLESGHAVILWIVAALILSQIMEYAFQIMLFRRSI